MATDTSPACFAESDNESNTDSQEAQAITRLDFQELCDWAIIYLKSPEFQRVYPPFVTTKRAKYNFRRRIATQGFKYDHHREKLFKPHKNQFGEGKYIVHLFGHTIVHISGHTIVRTKICLSCI